MRRCCPGLFVAPDSPRLFLQGEHRSGSAVDSCLAWRMGTARLKLCNKGGAQDSGTQPVWTRSPMDGRQRGATLQTLQSGTSFADVFRPPSMPQPWPFWGRLCSREGPGCCAFAHCCNARWFTGPPLATVYPGASWETRAAGQPPSRPAILGYRSLGTSSYSVRARWRCVRDPPAPPRHCPAATASGRAPERPPLNFPSVQVRGKRLRVVDSRPEHPDDATMFFVHGFGGQTAQWAMQIAFFASRLRVVALDFIGHGHSERPLESWAGYSASSLVADLQDVYCRYRSRHSENIIVAHSYGTSLVTQLRTSLTPVAPQPPNPSLNRRQSPPPTFFPAYPSPFFIVRRTRHNHVAVSPRLRPDVTVAQMDDELHGSVSALVFMGSTVARRALQVASYIVPWLPDVAIDALRRQETKGGLHSVSVNKFVHPDALEGMREKQLAWNKATPTPVVKRLLYGMRLCALEEYQQVKQPVLLLVGEADHVTPVKDTIDIYKVRISRRQMVADTTKRKGVGVL